MASKERFMDPDKKQYNKKMLCYDRMIEALIGIRTIQTYLWETMSDQAYEKIEKEFDTAIASIMMHICDIKLVEGGDESMEERCVCCGEIIPEGRQVCPQCLNLNGARKQQWILADTPPRSNKYVLLSFENFDVPMVGRYERDQYGGAYYIGDETESCVKQDVIVNAWMPLPKKYEGE